MYFCCIVLLNNNSSKIRAKDIEICLIRFLSSNNLRFITINAR